MSENATSRKVRRIGVTIYLCVFLGMILLFITLPILLMIGVPQVVWRLAAGWFFFLREHLSHMSTNAGTWVPGVAAFFIAIGVGHTFLRRWAKRRDRRWSLGSSLALGMIVPVLFVISFLVPGIILQTKELSGTKWFGRSASVDYNLQAQLVRTLQMEVLETASEQDELTGRFPASLAGLPIFEKIDRKQLLRGVTSEGPVELPIYLGAGFSLDSDPTLPLLISQPFGTRGGISRWVVNIGGELKEIRDNETDVWIQRSFDARPSEAR